MKAPKAQCEGCSLQEKTVVLGHGPTPQDCKAVLVGEAPGVTEEQKGRPFVGRAGTVLRSILQQLGIDPNDLYFTNTILCRPPANKIKRSPDAVFRCTKRLVGELFPYVQAGVPIFTLGKTAAQTLLGGSDSMNSLRGWHLDGKVYATWHPSSLFYVPQRVQKFILDISKIKNDGPIHLDPVNYKVVDNPDALRVIIEAVTSEPVTLCIDIETEYLNWWEHKVLSIGIAWSPSESVVVPKELVYDEEVRDILISLFDNPNVGIVGHNFKFDVRFLRQLGVHNAHVQHDTMLAHYVLDENSNHGLKQLLTDYLDVPDYEKELVKKHLKSSKSYYSDIPPECLYKYNALDVCYNLLLWRKFREMLEEEGLWYTPYMSVIIPSQNPLVDMELGGIRVDEDALSSLSDDISHRIEDVHKQLSEMCEKEFNPRSWQQVSQIMYEYYNMPKVRGRGYKVGSTCAAAREKIKGLISPSSEGYQWLELLETYRSLEKMRSSYVDNLPSYIFDGAVHPDYKVHGTEIGRLSASDPAIQTIPRAGTGEVGGIRWGEAIRSVFTVKPGHVWVKVDYSQAELRVAAALSGDSFLMDIYNNGRDLHTEVAIEMYGEDFTKEERQLCKNFNFSYLYGGTEYSFANEVGLDMEVAREFVRRYKKIMKGLTKWKEEQFKHLQENGYVTTRTGRMRRFPMITNANLDDARKSSVHAVVSGSASDITLLALIRLHRMNIEGVRIITMVHDEIDFEIREDRVKEAIPIIIGVMQEVGQEIFPEVPWVADAEVGPAWGKIKKVK